MSMAEEESGIPPPRAPGGLRGGIAVNRSPLARRIVAYNLAALVILVTGVLYLDPFRDSLVLQREASLVIEARLIADAIEMRADAAWVGAAEAGAQAGAADALAAALAATPLPTGIDVHLLDDRGRLLASAEDGAGLRLPEAGIPEVRPTLLTSALAGVLDALDRVLGRSGPLAEPPGRDPLAEVAALLGPARDGDGASARVARGKGEAAFWAAMPVRSAGAPGGYLAVVASDDRVEMLAAAEREHVLQLFVVAILVSVGVSLALASTIATPLSLLSRAAEIGRSGGGGPARVRIPDLTARTDEIGRLSGALRGMVAALYDRIDANEQFAADVAHEIKNPLASLRSATGTLRMAAQDDQRERLLAVIEHDVRRLDRLVSDISNASRLDSELVKEDEAAFDLLHMLRNLAQYLGRDAKGKGIAFLTDLPSEAMVISGLEARLAQVFVNVITNAISFCEEGDAIRMWVRRRENRVLVVVEDTGPGIPDGALGKIFARFYSERPEGQFGDNSGLGLAISKQIVEAHGGVIWAENIRPTEADPTSEPLGARFVVGLPL